MELEAAEVGVRIAPYHMYSIEECITKGRRNYDLHDYKEAFLWFDAAYERLDPQGATEQQRLEVKYYLYKSHAMAPDTFRERSKLPLTFLVLERQVREDETDRRTRAVKWYDQFGRMGLRAHDFLERRGR